MTPEKNVYVTDENPLITVPMSEPLNFGKDTSQAQKSKKTKENEGMKFAAAIVALFGSAVAIAPASSVQKSTSLNAFVAEELPGVLASVGFFDPHDFAEKADEATMKHYREAELTHGRVAMLASVPDSLSERRSRDLRSSLTPKSPALPSAIFLRFLLDSGLRSLLRSVLLHITTVSVIQNPTGT
jgi:hypothetical protein